MRRICSVLILLGLLLWLFSCGDDPSSILDAIIPELPGIVRGPYLGDVTRTSIVVSWATAESSDSVVEYATDAQYEASGNNYDQQTEGSRNVKLHSITLEGLETSTLYHYRVVSNSHASGDSEFYTAANPSEPFTLVAYGDSRTLFLDHEFVVDSIMEHNPRLVLDSGDLVSDGRVLPLWDVFFGTTGDLLRNVPYYPVLGNHENNSQFYYDLFHLPEGGGKENEQWYSFDYGNTHFVCLDSNARDSKEQLAWLEDDLAEYQKTTDIILLVENMPCYRKPGGRLGKWLNISDVQEWNRKKFWSLVPSVINPLCFPLCDLKKLEQFPHIILDTTHLGTGGFDPITVFDHFKDKVEHIHLSNFDGREHLELRTGKIDMGAFLRHVTNTGYTGGFCLEIMPEYFPSDNEEMTVELLTENLDFIREHTG